MEKKVTLKDIARECNVTKGAVSRALANKYNVSEEKAYFIKQKALEMGYDFKKLKKTKNQKNKALILCPSRLFFKENFWQCIVKNASNTLSSHSFKVDYLIFDENDISTEQINSIKKNDYSGFIVIHYNTQEIMATLAKLSLPTVVVDPRFPCDDFTVVTFSNLDSTYKATQYLINLGHKRIAYYGSDSHSLSFQERHKGFLSCVTNNKEIEHESIIFDNSTKNYADNELLKKELINFKPTALVCANDIIAINAYKVINNLGLKIPEDISVIGFDNIDSSSTCKPSLTTFDIPLAPIGEEAAEYLVNIIARRKINYSQIVIRCEFIERNSTKNRKD